MNKDKLKHQLEVHEGLRLQAYHCPAGHLTVGVGRNVETNPVVQELGRAITSLGDEITAEEAMHLLDNDIDRFAADVRGRIPQFDDLSEARQHVLVDMAFNMGTATLMKFQNMLTALAGGAYADAAAEMLDSRWAGQVHTRADRLAKMMSDDVSFEELVG